MIKTRRIIDNMDAGTVRRGKSAVVYGGIWAFIALFIALWELWEILKLVF